MSGMPPRAPLTIETVDWFRLLWSVIRVGYSLADIERRTGISSSTLRGYLDGSQPPHWRGELLIEMWQHECDKDRDSLPMVTLSLAPRVVHAMSQVKADEAAVKRLEEAWRAA